MRRCGHVGNHPGCGPHSIGIATRTRELGCQPPDRVAGDRALLGRVVCELVEVGAKVREPERCCVRAGLVRERTECAQLVVGLGAPEDEPADGGDEQQDDDDEGSREPPG